MDNILKYLAGSWQFERSVSEPNMHFNGKASFEFINLNTLTYYEKGQYILKNIAYDFFQKREFIYLDDILYIYKSNGKILHEFKIILFNSKFPINQTHQHKCANDIYHCDIKFLSDDHFQINYKITGPKKKYEIKTKYLKN